ncbi:MAG: thiamine-phosphate diphosphorylase [Planctomycetes bacterium GWF2_41_51]|nr:MAG: thiamine-phosphate diphosphorylase [Planctomycetes bacterium GWF2_41_51]
MNRAIYRIVDANYNRAREGLRIAEEFCRFALDNEQLATECKQCRHRLSSAVSKLDTQKLISSRDTENDVGCGVQIAEQMKRESLEDCVTAGLARTTEALRAISEAVSVINSELAGEFEKLRYDCYTLEKNISIYGFPAVKFSKARLYCIITVQNGMDALKIAQSCASGGADCLQLRAKEICDSELLPLAREFVHICKQNNVISIINDRADIAIAADADGVHLGQNDLPADEIRKMQLKPLIIGMSTHSMTELASAADQKLHYVGAGSVFSTNTKQQVEICGLDYVSKAVEYLKDKNIEAVAIGGITLENIDDVLRAGAKRIAVSSCVCNANDPGEVCKELKQRIEKYI